MMKTLLALVCVGFTMNSFAQNRSAKTQPLFFPADKNNFQALPQRFEYGLIDADRLKVGDILIDTTKVTFKIETTQDPKNPYRVQFTWPAGLIKEGELAIKNNSGKAVFTARVNPKNIQVSGVSSANDDGPSVRSEIATYNADLPATLIEDMKYFPFMVFCVYRESVETRLYLCSKELFLSDQKGQIAIRERSATKKVAQVDINGKVVGNQGIIYLNDSTESVAFKAHTQTGAFLEIETRKNDVDFKDVTVSEDGQKINLSASGAEPVDEKKVRKISSNEWQTALPASRPVLYMKGDGDIPMRQEFNIKGALPKAKFRPYIMGKGLQRTYSSEVHLKGVSPAGVQLSIPADDANSTLAAQEGQFNWNLRNLPAGEETRRYLNVGAGGEKFTVAYDISRGLPYALALGAHYFTPSGVASADIEFQWWMENFLGISSDWSRFHWGLSLERNQTIIEKDDTPKVDLTTVELLWRAEAGFNLVDGTWGLSLPVQMVQGESASATTYGLGAFWIQKPTSSWLKPFMHWSELKLQYFAGSSGSDFKISSAYHLKAQAYWKMSERFYIRYGLDLNQYKFDPAAPKEEMQFGLNGSAYWKF